MLDFVSKHGGWLVVDALRPHCQYATLRFVRFDITLAMADAECVATVSTPTLCLECVPKLLNRIEKLKV